MALRPSIIIAAVAVVAATAATAVYFLREPPAALPDSGAGVRQEGTDRSGRFTQLGEHLRREPNDARAWAIFARLNFERDRYADAATAYARAVALPGKVAQDPMIWCEYADALAMASGGKLEGEPRKLIDRALTINPKHPRALEMAGSAEIEKGDYVAALTYWEKLLDILPRESQEYREMAAAIDRARQRAGR